VREGVGLGLGVLGAIGAELSGFVAAGDGESAAALAGATGSSLGVGAEDGFSRA
jgi:hypothetical protein